MRKGEVEKRSWERGMEMCRGFERALRTLEWVVRPKGPWSVGGA